MAIERWDPFRDMHSMRDAMERFWQETVGRPMSSVFSEWVGSIPVDVSETDSGFVVRATMPGVRPEDIQISVHGDRLTLQAERQSEQERQGEHVLVRERHAATFYRTLTLPAPVSSDQADAKYEQGVLTITLPKAQPSKSAQIKVRGGDQPGSLPGSGSATTDGA
jgi:HSP20 family protein